MNKKKKNEQPMELNDVALEATSGGTIFVRCDDNTQQDVWGYTDVDGNVRKAASFADALILNGGKASKDDRKKLEEAGFTVWKPYFK